MVRAIVGWLVSGAEGAAEVVWPSSAAGRRGEPMESLMAPSRGEKSWRATGLEDVAGWPVMSSGGGGRRCVTDGEVVVEPLFTSLSDGAAL
jgi:hypothetical protein